MSMPAALCLRTISPTASRICALSWARSTGTPSSLAYMSRINRSGRGRLPVCVLRNRSVLRFIVFSVWRPLEDRPDPERQSDQCDETATQNLAITLERAEPHALEALCGNRAQHNVSRDCARGEQQRHRDDQAGAEFAGGKKRRHAFDHRRRAEDEQQGTATGCLVVVVVQRRIAFDCRRDRVGRRIGMRMQVDVWRPILVPMQVHMPNHGLAMRVAVAMVVIVIVAMIMVVVIVHMSVRVPVMMAAVRVMPL